MPAPGSYLVALGSNVRHPRHGDPRKVLAAALDSLGRAGLAVVSASPPVSTAPIGPSQRHYANSAAIVASDLPPEKVLDRLKRIERDFGRTGSGQRWRARVLDLDIILWSGGSFGSAALVIPHIAYRDRSFVLGPAATVAASWRDPITGLTIKQLHTRLTRPRPAPR
ncbi:2-amino-4-hydroxy-6-hydroxymethyldihydropteridine diphosphokinase [Allopontixanthobacter sediminis]|uniref:2-amino-4-hydroxy-6-hydroxymethyldihydropteridine pyrophosphokinase n=1 Tax=Allopontixanthobacter sediminis TaxID=1689985 RepID=A0A845B5W1_9SPHN|nr:2-amino-4-hydroxy-6-hydroxymethyldihydropteridine diphosphokinase [Allopontixanthobacter sediminis]MXP45534.1 2-amino-4-hydroxy-6-hydroxymethyldihydropteridine diphosphokinase [Allopontixanthobacter sediminis]